MTVGISTKAVVIDGLTKIAKLSRLAGENNFKCMAYDRAIDTLSGVSEAQLADANYSTLIQLEGIGDSIALKIEEIIQTGTCKALNILMDEHGDKLPLMEVYGVGPKTALKFYVEGMRTPEDIIQQVKEGKIKTKRIVEGAEHFDSPKKVSYDTALMVAEDLIDDLKKALKSNIGRIEACGSLRRHKEEIGDLDIVVEVLSSPTDIPSLVADCLDSFSEMGEHKICGRYCELKVQVRLASPNCYGAMILYFTGSKFFNINLRHRAIKHSMTLNEYGL